METMKVQVFCTLYRHCKRSIPIITGYEYMMLMKRTSANKISSSCILTNNIRSYYHSPSSSERFTQMNAPNSIPDDVHPLVDNHNRFHDYLRVSLTEKCNLRCVYCMPVEGVKLTSRPELLSLEERKRIISIFHHLGMRKIRFTGGEPTISNQLVPLVAHAASLGIKSVGITTNGLELGVNRKRIDELVSNGLTSMNISLDSLIPTKFSKITRRDEKNLYHVLSAIHYAASIPNLHVKINCVLMKGVNDDELHSFMNFIRDAPIDFRMIEVMPFDGNDWSPTTLMSYHEAIDIIQSASPSNLSNPAISPNPVVLKPILKDLDTHDTTKWFQPIDAANGMPYQGRVGFITSMTSHFCGGCNRLRVTADGNLKVCLFGDETYSLRDSIRAGASNEDMITQISAAVKRKKAVLGGHGTPENIAASLNRPMILIGG